MKVIDRQIRPVAAMAFSVWVYVRHELSNLDIRKPLHAIAIAILIGGISAPLVNLFVTNTRYKMSSLVRAVVEQPSPTFGQKLRYDVAKKSNIFNESGQIAAQTTNAPDKLTSSLGAGGKKDTQLYTATLPDDPSLGISVHDNVNNVTIGFIPQIDLMNGRAASGQVIYPINGQPGQLVFTPKANGLKEDIVLTSAPQSDTMEYQYKLDIPDTVSARLEDDGSVGFYTATPELFGDISYGSDTDRTAVEKARVTSEKTYLMFKIPAPTLKETGPNTSQLGARFGLDGKTLTVRATGLDKAHYPLSIDPTFVLTSTTDFVLGSIDDNIDLSVDGQVGRQTLVGGSTPGWSAKQAPNLAYAQYASSLVAYNGFLYLIGGGSGAVGGAGTAGTTTNDVRYISLNPNTGALGGSAPTTWIQAGNLLITARQGSLAFGFNGYLYAVGGQDNNGVPITAANSVEYAKINADGTVSAWAHTSNLNTVRAYPAGALYQGVLYVMGGTSGTNNATPVATVEYARINGNGSVSTWTQSTSTSTGNLTSARSKFAGAAYNGYVYIAGGQTSTTAVINTVQYAPIQSDGSLGAWATTTSFPTPRRDAGMVVSNGYMYVFAGCTGAAQACAGFIKDMQYAVINADGTIGQWQSALPYNSGFNDGVADYNSRMPGGYTSFSNHLYFTGGCSAETATNNCATQLVGTFISNIDAVGRFDNGISTLASPPYTGTSSIPRSGGKTVALNGYVYYVGGCSSASCSIYSPTVESAVLNSDGTLGNFIATTSLPAGSGNEAGRMGTTLTAYKKQLYVIGGIERPATYPTVTSITPTTIATAATAHAIAMPTSVSSGDLLLTMIGIPGGTGTTITVPTGWTLVGTQTRGTVARAGVYAKISVGNEGGTTVGFTTSNAQTMAAQVYSIPAASWYGNIANGIANANIDPGAATTTPDPPALTTSWGTADSLWIAMVGAASYPSVNTYPTSFTGGTHTVTGSGVTGSSVSSAVLASQNATLNPGTFTMSASGSGVPFTVAIRPPDNHVYMSSVLTATQATGGVLGSWSTQASLGGNDLPAARAYQTTEIWHNYAYVIGGRDASNVYGTIYYAAIDPVTGTIGAWNTASSTVQARWGASGGAWGKWLYVVSGQSNTAGAFLGSTAAANAVQRLTLNEQTGDVTAVSGFASSTATRFAGGFVHNGFLYSLGGDQAGTVTGAMAWTALDPVTGAPGTFSTANIGNIPSATAGLATARSQLGAVDAGGYVYLIGGCSVGIATTSYDNCSTMVPTANTTEVYLPNNGGSGQLSSWTSPNSMNTPRADFGAVAYNGYVYAIGGCSAYTTGGCSTILSSVEAAPINADGTLGTWTAQASLPSGRSWYQTVVYNGYLYAISGRDATNTATTSVLYAPIAATGTLGSWIDSSSNYLPSGAERYGFGAATSNGYIYIGGGYNSAGTRINTVYYSQITATGALAADAGCGSTWCAASSFATARGALNLVAYNGVLYTVGGVGASSATLDDIQYAQINADGSIGTWNYTSDISQGQTYRQVVAANGYMYFIGDDGSQVENNFAPINADGTLGAVQNITNDMPGPHSRAVSVFYDGVFYVLGGCSSYTGVNRNTKANVDRAGQQAVSRVGHYSKLFDTQVDTSPTQLVINGSAASGNSAVEFRFQTASSSDPVLGVAQLIRPVVFGQFYNVQALNSSGVNVGVAFNYQYQITLDDSRSGTFPDVVKSGYSQSAVTDVTLYYHANPARRLRHGASFTNTACNPTDPTQGCILDTAP